MARSLRSRTSSVWTVTNVVTLVFTVLEVLLLLRFVFKLTGANSNQPLIRALYGATEPLIVALVRAITAPKRV